MCDPVLGGIAGAVGYNAFNNKDKRKDRERQWTREDQLRAEDRQWYADQRSSNRDELTADSSKSNGNNNSSASGGTA